MDAAKELVSNYTKVWIVGKSSSSCGYCHSTTSTSISYGFFADNMSTMCYEELYNKGWSRSGKYMYLPLNCTTCCPQYQIRLPIKQYKPHGKAQNLNKLHNKVRNGLRKLLNNDEEDILVCPLESSKFSEEKYDLYRKYQINVHHDKPQDVTPEGFTRFLVDSPLIGGTYHQCYRLKSNAKLIAVSVLDILPSGLCSCYCFYDPELRSAGLGKYTALIELAYCQEKQFEYYYMGKPSIVIAMLLTHNNVIMQGFYVHSCSKMVYKAEYKPSQLLCCLTHEWVDITPELLSKLQQFRYLPLVEPHISKFIRTMLQYEEEISNQANNNTENKNESKFGEDEEDEEDDKEYEEDNSKINSLKKLYFFAWTPRNQYRLDEIGHVIKNIPLSSRGIGNGILHLRDLPDVIVHQAMVLLYDFVLFAGADFAEHSLIHC